MHRSVSLAASVATAAAIAAAAVAGNADAHGIARRHFQPPPHFQAPTNRLVPGSVVISGSVFPRNGVNITAGTTQLPYANNYSDTSDPEPTTDPGLVTAVANGNYPYVFNNASADASFGVATPIDLWDVSTFGQPLGLIPVPANDMSTSFESKSELALNVSTNGQDLSWLGYAGAVGSVDESNANTPGVFDPTNPDVAGENSTLTAGGIYRVAGTLSSNGQWTFTDTNAYSGDNGRATLLDNTNGNDDYLAAGNDNNGYTGKKDYPTIPTNLVDATGAQVFQQSFAPQSEQDPGAPTELGTFSFSSSDKPGKDTNFRGLAVYNNVVYYTKGSGSNGSNTVYFLNTSGTPCPTVNGVAEGLPTPGAQLPSSDPATPYQMCILAGFNDQAASTDTSDFPFGIWFANADTLYVADEGNGNFATSTDPANDPYQDAQQEVGTSTGGLQKWVFNQGAQKWERVYTIQAGLNIGQPYTVPGYPTGDNTGAGGSNEPWAPATDGLRNIAGRVNGNGTVTIYATTSTVSGSGDQGGDPNQVVAVTDMLGENTLPPSEHFDTFAPARFGVRYGGIAVLPSDFGVQPPHGFNPQPPHGFGPQPPHGFGPQPPHGFGR